MHTRPCYQLSADGHSRNGWRFRMRSKAVFARRAAAERYIAEFEAACTDARHLESAVPGTLKIEIVELDLHD